jgi:hypothetical protein
MGALKSFEDIWFLGKRTRREVGIVAREILCLEDSERCPIAMNMPEVATYDMNNLLDSHTSSEFDSFFDNIPYSRIGETTDVFV